MSVKALMHEPLLITETCGECEQDLEHCHGTAIVHCDACAECAEDPDCHLVADQHLFAIACQETACACSAPQAGADWVQAAAS
jgi:hypothetical protein